MLDKNYLFSLAKKLLPPPYLLRWLPDTESRVVSQMSFCRTRYLGENVIKLLTICQVSLRVMFNCIKLITPPDDCRPGANYLISSNILPTKYSGMFVIAPFIKYSLVLNLMAISGLFFSI